MYFACKYYGIDSTLKELSDLCGKTDEGTSMFDLKNGIIKKGLYAEAFQITPDMLLGNSRYFLILPVKEYSNKIDHYDVVMGSKGKNVLLLNYPTRPWYFPISKLINYWDGQVLAVSDRPIPKYALVDIDGIDSSSVSNNTALLLFISLLLIFITMYNIYLLLRPQKMLLTK